MPKLSKSHSSLLREWIFNYPDEIFTTDGKIIDCQRGQSNQYFSIISNSLTKLEAQGLILAQNLDILTEIKAIFSTAAGPIGEEVRKNSTK